MRPTDIDEPARADQLQTNTTEAAGFQWSVLLQCARSPYALASLCQSGMVYRVLSHAHRFEHLLAAAAARGCRAWARERRACVPLSRAEPCHSQVPQG